ncbi:hypothetical protein LY28_00017 [Ruminiclostridium sufflavum DSM 19573]|uniref:Uncharacterized protein n=1 Tax=Ruminiclostridium sufflavum DSM 19573 TaxID=1121337 RepID=A0A318XRD7_9FIRM|nr:hypothetical protein [Ruminiclostridium sufflavum]PYG90137.1 hypothetical protein LY28_00017 [Ruminiclostridium sufflavum DSM 19573]
MSKVINITDKLISEKPVIQIGDRNYPVNDGMSTVLKFEELAVSGTSENMVEAILIALGEQAAKELDVANMPIANFKVLSIAIMAAVQGVEYEEAAARFQE